MDLILLALAASEQGDVDLGLPEYREQPQVRPITSLNWDEPDDDD